jgi:sulfotransferase family protein
MSLLNAVKRLLNAESKPPPPDRPEKYLFIICMNNGGSTLLERVISECRNAVGFPAPGGPDKQVNGQGFVREFMPVPRNMTPNCRRIWSEQANVLENESRYDWPKIKQRWREVWARNPKFQTANPRVFLEKSPPSVFRASMLQSYFESSFFVLMNRNPYAVAEGIRRRAKLPIDRCVQHWIRCAQQQIRNEQNLRRKIRLSYEELSGNPEYCRDKVVQLVPELSDLDLGKDVAVHSIEGHVRQRIVNYNPKQIATLSSDDLAATNRHLAQVPEVMAHFGYDYIRR